MLPQSFDGLILQIINHNYNTRNKDDQYHTYDLTYIIPMTNVIFMFQLNTVLKTGLKILNNLPKHIKCSKTSIYEKTLYHFLTRIKVALSEGKLTFWLFILSKQIIKYIIPSYMLIRLFCLPLYYVCVFVVIFILKIKGKNIFQVFAFSCISSILCLFSNMFVVLEGNKSNWIRWRTDYIIGFFTSAIGPNKSEKLTRLIAPAHNIRGKVWMKNNM